MTVIFSYFPNYWPLTGSFQFLKSHPAGVHPMSNIFFICKLELFYFSVNCIGDMSTLNSDDWYSLRHRGSSKYLVTAEWRKQCQTVNISRVAGNSMCHIYLLCEKWWFFCRKPGSSKVKSTCKSTMLCRLRSCLSGLNFCRTDNASFFKSKYKLTSMFPPLTVHSIGQNVLG